MKTSTITMVHTVFPVVASMTKLFAEKAKPGRIRLFNLVDDSLIPRLKAGDDRAKLVRALYEHLVVAEDSGADVVLVTCSSISEIVDLVRPLFAIPVVKIDDAMTDRAV